MSAKIDKLSQMVIEFVRAQPGYNAEKEERVYAFLENEQSYVVVYGKNKMEGIMGFGTTVKQVFDDFVLSWNELREFKSKNKNI